MDISVETFSKEDRKWMRRALALARRGWGLVKQNPLVGALVVKNGTIYGCGWHQGPGTDHAEKLAIEKAGKMSVVLLFTLP